jgi:hypothetical protein
MVKLIIGAFVERTGATELDPILEHQPTQLNDDQPGCESSAAAQENFV